MSMYCPATACVRVISFLYMYYACVMPTSLSYTMRGWPFVVIELWVSIRLSLPCHYVRLVSFLFPFNTCISPDHLAYHYLARPYCYYLTYPDHYQSLDLIGYWLHITTCHAITLYPAWYTWHAIIFFTGTWLIIMYHDQWPIFLLYMQWPDYIVLMYSWFLIMSISCFSRKVIIKLLNLKIDQLILGRGKYADIDMCSCLQWY